MLKSYGTIRKIAPPVRPTYSVIQWALTLHYGRRRGVLRLEGRRELSLRLIRAALPSSIRALPKLRVTICIIRPTLLGVNVFQEQRIILSSRAIPICNYHLLREWSNLRWGSQSET